jgi:hypothetical protein
VIAAIKGRPAHETLESLRLTLLKIEQDAEPEQDAEALAELKRILLQRIAELEAIQVLEIQAVESADAQTSEKTNPAELVPPASIMVDDSKGTAALANAPTASVEPPVELE